MIAASIVCMLGILLADQGIKYWICQNFQLGEERAFLRLGSWDLLHLKYIQNDGSIFGSFSGHRIFLLVVSGALVIFGLYMLFFRMRQHPLVFWTLTAVLGGALGNLADRIFRGSVVDYLKLELFDFPIFNLADCFVTVGVFLLLVVILFAPEEKKPEVSDDSA